MKASAAESTAVTLTHGNDYNSAYLDAKNRASIQPYGITIPSGVTLTAKTGYQFGFYSVSNISTPTTASMLGGGWIDTFTTTSNGTYGIAVKKLDDSDFNFSTDSIYVVDYINSTDSSIFGDSGSSTPSTPSVSTGAQRLTATITPEDALDSKVNWTISWKNPASTWANGKAVTDYVTLTPSTDNGLIADVECLQAFGEQVVVGVELVSNTEIKSSCTVDYIKRVSDVKIGKILNGTIFESSTLVFGAENAFGAIVTYSDGTIEGKLSFGALTAEMNSTFQSKVKEYMTDVTTSYTFKSSILMSNFVDGASILLEYPKDMFIMVFGDTSVVYPKFTNGFYQACMLVSGMHGTLSVPYEYSYGETIINSGRSVTDQIRFSTDNLSYEVTNIVLDYGSIVF